MDAPQVRITRIIYNTKVQHKLKRASTISGNYHFLAYRKNRRLRHCRSDQVPIRHPQKNPSMYRVRDSTRYLFVNETVADQGKTLYIPNTYTWILITTITASHHENSSTRCWNSSNFIHTTTALLHCLQEVKLWLCIIVSKLAIRNSNTWYLEINQ